MAIAKSGRYDQQQKAVLAWPWTINAEGDGEIFPTKAAAIAKVKRLQAKGVQSIDVGCMQINLKHHPNAFANLETAFDPGHIAYGAEFLRGRYEATKSWNTAGRITIRRRRSVASRTATACWGSGRSSRTAATPRWPRSTARRPARARPPSR